MRHAVVKYKLLQQQKQINIHIHVVDATHIHMHIQWLCTHTHAIKYMRIEATAVWKHCSRILAEANVCGQKVDFYNFNGKIMNC